MAGIYAKPGLRLVRQVLSDLFAVVWVVGWFGASSLVHGLITSVANSARDMADIGRGTAGELAEASERVTAIPAVGEALARPFDSMASGLIDLVARADNQASTLDTLAWLAAIVTFLIPVGIMLWLWLPRRIRFWTQARATQQFIDSGADLDLFALRAMANLPMTDMVRISADPVRAWREGDERVIRELAELAFDREGIRAPKSLPRT
ncbi:MAG TPA: hypothetical protein VLR88_09335 [Propionibacteriaceae bacterium]|nr:hypothetical protein [Propionibacteriaceae bacterium]